MSFACHFGKTLKKARFSKILQNELFEKLSEPSLGSGASLVEDMERVDEGLKLDLRRCLRGTGFLLDVVEFSLPFEIN